MTDRQFKYFKHKHIPLGSCSCHVSSSHIPKVSSSFPLNSGQAMVYTTSLLFLVSLVTRGLYAEFPSIESPAKGIHVYAKKEEAAVCGKHQLVARLFRALEGHVNLLYIPVVCNLACTGTKQVFIIQHLSHQLVHAIFPHNNLVIFIPREHCLK